MKSLFIAFAALLLLAGCSMDRPGADAVEDVGPKLPPYQNTGPAALTLITVRNNETGAGGHTALIIEGDQSVIFDPAGSFHYPTISRKGDVLEGMSPAFVEAYVQMHARPAFNVLMQRVEVPRSVANRALKLAYERGPVADAFCAHSTSKLLKQLPGFEGIRVTMFPVSLSRRFAKVTGVAGKAYYEEYTPTPEQLKEDAGEGILPTSTVLIR